MSTLRVEHRTTFTYEREIVSSYNEARLTPAWLPRQRVLDSRIDISPVTWRTTYRDYWETDVLAFEVLQPHSSLTVVGTSIVEVTTHRPRDERVGWSELQGPRSRDLLCEYLENSPVTEPTDELRQIAEDAAGTLAPDLAARAKRRCQTCSSSPTSLATRWPMWPRCAGRMNSASPRENSSTVMTTTGSGHQ